MWDKYVWESNNGTMFHTRKFLSYHQEGRFTDHSLMFYDGDKIAALFPAAIRVIAGKTVLASHCGASYGGFVCNEKTSIRKAFDLVSGLLDYARKEGVDTIDMTLPPFVYLERPTHYLDFALYKSGFTYRKREVSSVIPLDFTADDIYTQFKPEARTAARRSRKLGVDIRITEDFDRFYPILKKNLAMRHNVNPTHTLQELLLLKKLFPDRVLQFGAYLDNTMIAGVTMFLCNSRVALAFYISHDESYQKYRPVNLLFYEIIKWSIENGYRFLDYGIFTVNEDPNWGLGKFKESFGARGILRETFQIDL